VTLPKLAICGYGESGKDTASIWLAENTPLRYTVSTSAAAAEVVFNQIRHTYGYDSVEECHADRKNHRELWGDIIREYNEPYGLTLYDELIETNDILNGIRRRDELHAVREAGLVDLVIWIDRVTPPDHSCDLYPGDADIVIWNFGTLEEFYGRLKRFADFGGLLEESHDGRRPRMAF